MVHALSEAQRVVRATVPDADTGPPFARGVLDIRPRPSDPVVAVRTRAGGEVSCGPLRRLDPDNDHTAAAEQALAVA
ncbi:MAG: hypothetical protein ACE5FI_18915, partial [Anaerolineales bacterium]